MSPKIKVLFSFCILLLLKLMLTIQRDRAINRLIGETPYRNVPKNMFPFLSISAHDGNPCYWVPGESYTLAIYHGAVLSAQCAKNVG